MAINTMVSPHMPERQSLPDHVIDKILGLLPTKPAVQVSFPSNQRGGVFSSFPLLDFDEEDDFNRNNLNLSIDFQNHHDKFINFLDGYLEYREKYDQKAVLNKLRLHLWMYLGRDEDTITNWLKYAFERGVKDLDINIPQLSSDEILDNYCFCLPWVTFANARSRTHLKLEGMRLTTIQKAYVQSHDQHLLPSLETMSFASVWFDDKALPSLLRECPSIKSLSVTECCFSFWECHVSSSSLKPLEIKECDQLRVLKVDDAKNLETLTFQQLSPNSYCEKVILSNSCNLKHISICVDELGDLSVFGCHRALEASVTTQDLQYFEFIYGHLSAKVSVKAIEARILLVWELTTDKEWCSSSSTHIPKLMTFLKGLRCCKEIYLHKIQDVEALIVPKSYRKMTSHSPLPNSRILEVRTPNAPVTGSRVYLELMDSLKWIAPSARISIIQQEDV